VTVRRLRILLWRKLIEEKDLSEGKELAKAPRTHLANAASDTFIE
jgi:hypothetical protein